MNTQIELSARQLDVLRLMAEGLTDRQIAGRLGIAPGTVSSHSRDIYRLIGVRTRLQAVLFGYRRGLLVLETPQTPRQTAFTKV